MTTTSTVCPVGGNEKNKKLIRLDLLRKAQFKKQTVDQIDG